MDKIDEFIEGTELRKNYHQSSAARKKLLREFAEGIVRYCAETMDYIWDAGIAHPGDYLVEHLGLGTEEGATEWRSKGHKMEYMTIISVHCSEDNTSFVRYIPKHTAEKWGDGTNVFYMSELSMFVHMINNGELRVTNLEDFPGITEMLHNNVKQQETAPAPNQDMISIAEVREFLLKHAEADTINEFAALIEQRALTLHPEWKEYQRLKNLFLGA